VRLLHMVVYGSKLLIFTAVENPKGRRVNGV
jgi:hypothetical protein